MYVYVCVLFGNCMQRNNKYLLAPVKFLFPIALDINMICFAGYDYHRQERELKREREKER